MFYPTNTPATILSFVHTNPIKACGRKKNARKTTTAKHTTRNSGHRIFVVSNLNFIEVHLDFVIRSLEYVTKMRECGCATLLLFSSVNFGGLQWSFSANCYSICSYQEHVYSHSCTFYYVNRYVILNYNKTICMCTKKILKFTRIICRFEYF